jgi:VCBS repeat-containing protein
MVLPWWYRPTKKQSQQVGSRAAGGKARRGRGRCRLGVEVLEGRVVPAGRLFAVPLSPDNTILELNPATGAVINSFAAPEPTGPGAVGLAFDGSRLFYLNGLGSDTLFQLNPDTGAVVDSNRITAGSGNYDGLAVVGSSVYIQDYNADQVFVFDPGSRTVTRTLTPGVDLVGGLAGATGPDALIATVNAGSAVVEIDPVTGVVTHSFNPGIAPVYGVAVVNNQVYLGSGNANVLARFSRDGASLGQLTLPGPVAALGSDDVTAPQPTEVVVNGGFEAGTTSGWTVFNAPGSQGAGFQTYAGPHPQQSTLPAPPEGNFAVYDNHTGPGTYILYQDVALAAGQYHTLSLQAFYQNQFTQGFLTPDTLDYRTGPNQQFRIDLVSPSADLLSTASSDVLLNLFRTTQGSPASRDPFTLTADLTPFAGQTVRLRIAVANNQFFLFGGVDDVQLVSSTQPPAGTVSGVKFNDLDGNGVRDPGEPGLPGWTVYADLNDNRQLDAGEPFTVTGADGSYTLTLPPGSYVVREVLQAGWRQTAPGGGHLFAARVSQNGGTPTIYELSATGAVLNSFAAPAPLQGQVGPQGLAEGGGSLFYIDGTPPVGAATGPHTLYELDPATGAVRDADVLPATGGIAGLGYLNGLVYLQVYTTNQILAFDPVSDTVVRTLPVTDLIGGLTGASDLGLLFGSNFNGQVRAIDPATGAVVRALNPGVGQLGGGLAYYNGELIGAAFAAGPPAFRIDPVTGAVLGSFPIGGTGTLVALGGDGTAMAYRVTVAVGQSLTGKDFGNKQNVAPVAVDDAGTTDEDHVLNVPAPGVLANDTDGDPGDTRTVAAVNGSAAAVGTTIALPSGALLTLRADGSYTYNPNGKFDGMRAGQTASETFTYTVTDGMGASSTATVTVTVTGVNDAPAAAGASFTTDEDSPVSGTLSASDAEGDPLTFALVGGPVHGTLVFSTNGTFTYTPAANFNGPDSFTYRVSDGTADSNVATVVLTVNPVNDAPVAVGDAYATDEDTPLTVAAPGVLANDTDVDGDALRVALVSGPAHGGLALNADGSFTYTPAANFNGSDSFTYKANDGPADSNTATVTLTVRAVNDAPVARDDSYTTNEDAPLTVGAPGVLANDTDVEGDALAAVLVSGPAHGSLALSAGGSFVYTPAADFNGTDGFTYKANDGSADSNVAAVTITVRPVNDAPVAANDAYSVNEDTTLTVGAPGVLSNDSDVDGDALSAVLVAGPSHGTLALNAGGGFTYTPAANFNGADAFTYRVSDGTLQSNTATVTITVNPVNDAPVAANDAYRVDEDTPLVVGAPGVLANDTDVEGDPLTAALVAGPSHGTLALSSSGSFTYTPAANYNGADSFTYKANDGTADSNVATVTLTITPVNDAPSATGDSYSTDEDTPLTVAAPGVLGNDSDVDGDPLAAALVSGPAHGTLALNADGSFTYTPLANFFGSDSFTYRASDGPADSDVATVALTVNPVNDAPTVAGQTVTVTEDGEVAVALSGSDVETPAGGLTFTVVTLPARGALYAGSTRVRAGDTFTGPPTLTYRPALGLDDVAPDAFIFTVGDGALTSAPGTFTVTVVRAVADGTATIDAAGVVRIGGTAGSDVITAAPSKDRRFLVVTVNGATVGTFALSAVREVRAWGRAGDDRIDIANLAVASVLNGGAGNDTLIGGAADDLLFGGTGADSLYGNSGDDFLVGGDGGDRFTGDSGDDVLVGGTFARPWTLPEARAFQGAWAAGGNPQLTTDLSVLDTQVDTLVGGSNRDLFVIGPGDSTDRRTKDRDVVVGP